MDRHTAGKAWIAGSAVILLLGATSLAGAQPRQPVADVAVGSQILWPVDPEDPGVVPGWFVSVDEHRTDQMAIAYEFEHYFRGRSDTHGDTRHWYIGLAGIRYAWPGRRVTPFVQFLAGAGVLRVHEELPRTYRRTFRELMSKRDSSCNLGAGWTSLSRSAWRFGSRPTS